MNNELFTNKDILDNCLIGKLFHIVEDETVTTSKTFSLQIKKPTLTSIQREMLMAARNELLYEFDHNTLELFNFVNTTENIQTTNLKEKFHEFVFDEPCSIIFPYFITEDIQAIDNFLPAISAVESSAVLLLGSIKINGRKINCYSSLVQENSIFIVKHDTMVFKHKKELLTTHIRNDLLEIDGHFSINATNASIIKLEINL